MGGSSLCLVLASGCSPETKHKLLHVFFTGVDRTNAALVTVTAPGTTNPVASALATPPPEFIHKPYGENDCAACHLNAESQQLRVTGGALCLECHEKLLAKAKFVHAPVEAGACDLCHEPHKSLEPFLLKRKSQELCLDCHAAATMAKIKAHATNDSLACVQCHNPHQSEQPKLAKARP